MLLLLAVGLIAGSSATAAFIFRAGDSVWVDGKRYTWEEWKKIRDEPALANPSRQTDAASAGPRAAACTTAIYYDEFPSEDERFECTAGLGALTREQILTQGWKVDFVEKIPPATGQPAQSPRGLPLNLYKLVISRSSPEERSAPRPQPAAPSTPKPARLDTMCVNDCLGNGGGKAFCEDRCSY